MKRSGKEAVLEPHEKRKRQRELLQPYIQDCQKRGIRVTQAALKTAYFLNDLLVKEEVLKQISLLRKNFDIPEEGLELESMILKEILAHPFYLPTEGYSLIKEFRDRIRPIEERIPIRNFESISIILRLFALFDLYDIEFAVYLFASEGVCKIIDTEEEWEDYQPGNKKTNESFFNHLKGENKYYPVIIRISPFATQRDVVDFIKANWKTVEDKLDKKDSKKEKLGKTKKKDLKKTGAKQIYL